MPAGGERIVLAAFALNGVLAGGNAVGIRYSNRELEPLWGAGLRFALAAALLLALMAALGGALCFAQAAVLVRRLPPLPPVSMNAVGMTVGAALLIAASLLVGESRALPRDTETWAAIGYLVVVGSVAVFLLYLFVLGRWSASRAAYVFVVIPFVTVLLSAWLDDEPVGWGLVGGGLLVLAGVYVGALRAVADQPSP